MKDVLGKKWIIVCFIWAIVLLLTLFNHTMIRKIDAQRTLSDARTLDIGFVQRHRSDIEEMIARKTAYCQPVESIQIGYLALKTALNGMAAQHNLMMIQVNCDPDQADAGILPINLTMTGTFADVLEWLFSLEKDYAYASATLLKVQRLQDQQIPQFEIRIQYHFELSEKASSD